MKKKLGELFIKIGSRLTFDENLHIQKIENGFIFGGKYFKNLDNLFDELKKAMKEYYDL